MGPSLCTGTYILYTHISFWSNRRCIYTLEVNCTNIIRCTCSYITACVPYIIIIIYARGIDVLIILISRTNNIQRNNLKLFIDLTLVNFEIMQCFFFQLLHQFNWFCAFITIQQLISLLLIVYNIILYNVCAIFVNHTCYIIAALTYIIRSNYIFIIIAVHILFFGQIPLCTAYHYKHYISLSESKLGFRIKNCYSS